MAISAIVVLAADQSDSAFLLAGSYELNVSIFYRSNVKELIVFTARTIASRTKPGERRSVEQDQYTVHSFNRNGLCGLVFADKHYPSSFLVLREVLDKYEQTFGNSWRQLKADKQHAWPWLDEALKKFQDPVNVDKILKITKDLDDTKVILHKTIDSILDRGEKLDSLAQKSSDLSFKSREFYKVARKTNQCCSLA
ncbi:hypothetical protein SELMODRAFT_112680 [Selaginella moellendorffii]|uniref:VAMP-like protein YKT61 n=1 Tax=Selaginella moellendorffii TaxID=88036 RepID=D8SAD7_SELML|nr:VAMP-like protein YKT61 [Selaginella moellendorffii]EFJ18584.1 hypothetical protein SELMODRAFT_112680 [Selaginella moellendorffii]|eukprot:XP_002980324.1 VAMP-like protein YKT61 [Selaginella moellendorffii]